jgi:hypothetical protein
MRSEINEQTNLVLFYKSQTENYMKLNASLEQTNKVLTIQNENLTKDHNELNNIFQKTKFELEEKLIGLNQIINQNNIQMENMKAEKFQAINDTKLSMEKTISDLTIRNEKTIEEILLKSEKDKLKLQEFHQNIG